MSPSTIPLSKRAVYVIIIALLAVLAVEVGVRILLGIARRDVITVLPRREVLAKAWFKPHPYLVYVFKPDNSFVMEGYGRHTFTINKHGFRSTLEFDVESTARATNTLRIATVGGSTTMGVNDDDEIWPYLTAKNLTEIFPQRPIEVLNEGIMGYTSLDNLLDLSMRIVDFDCDVYVLYLGVNDLLPRAPLEVFRTDYSHFRRTLHENLHRPAADLLPSWILELKSLRWILQTAGYRDSRDLIANTGTTAFRKYFDVAGNEAKLAEGRIRETVLRNVKSMIGVIRVHRPDALILLSSFFDLQNRDFIQRLNQDYRRLAPQQGVVFVDAATRVPRSSKMVYHDYHLTPEGDACMGSIFAEAITATLATKE